MERLLYSSAASTPLKIQAKHSPFLPKLDRFRSSTLGFPSQNRHDARRRFNSISCKNENQFPASFSRSNQSDESPCLSSPRRVNSGTGFMPKSNLIDQIAEGASRKQKAISAGTVVFISSIITFLLYPVFAPATALATAVGGKLVRTGLLSSAWTGFFAGCLHTLSGPDHLAALAPLSIGRTRLESAAVGALWGCGHDAGQVIFGLIFLLLKDRLHIEIIQTWGARIVGLTLLVIGAMGIKEASEVVAPTPLVVADGYGPAVQTPVQPVQKKKIGLATFATGIVHGLQPDALMMVLPALALPSRVAGAAFLIMFLLGTVFAMGSYTVFIGSFSEVLKDRVPKITEKLTWASSLIAIALGLSIIVSQFFGYTLY